MNENITRYLEDQRTIRSLRISNNILFCATIFLFFAFLYATYLLFSPSWSIKNAMGEGLNNNCSNLDMNETAYCLRNELSKFYFYNISQVRKELTEEELKESGGVCGHYADWYLDKLIELGAKPSKEGDIYWKEKNSSKFYVKRIVVPTDGETSHAFTVVSSKNGWCALDMEDVVCLRRGK